MKMSSFKFEVVHTNDGACYVYSPTKEVKKNPLPKRRYFYQGNLVYIEKVTKVEGLETQEFDGKELKIPMPGHVKGLEDAELLTPTAKAMVIKNLADTCEEPHRTIYKLMMSLMTVTDY
jgi:hypothetical protein